MASELPVVHTVTSSELARQIHSQEGSVFLLDCRPVLSFSSCHISGAANINLASMMKKRFMAGKIGLVDLISSTEGKELLQNGHNVKVVVYDECTTDPKTLSANNTAFLVIMALGKLGKTPLLLKGGISEFGVLHPSLCEVSVSPLQRAISTGPRATTPGQRDQALDWKTAPPVFILSYLILGSEKDAHCKEVLEEFGVKYILNVTANCPNYFEEEQRFVYKRIAVSDTGTQKLSQYILLRGLRVHRSLKGMNQRRYWTVV
jgi:dual specificity MAP kinase phosphatase